MPAWWLADEYHAALRAVASLILAVRLPPGPAAEIEVDATQVLAAYGAMCLASVHASLARRLVSLAAGLVLLFGLELLTGIVAIRTDALVAAGGIPAALVRLSEAFLVSPPWLGAPLIWLLLLGRWELRRFRGPRGRDQSDKGAAAGTAASYRGPR